MSKKVLIIIQCERGQHTSSIIRALSQILIALNERTIVNIGEIGLRENISSIVRFDNLSIGVACQNDIANSALDMIKDLKDKSCDLILCVTRNNPSVFTKIEEFSIENEYTLRAVKSYWSPKLEVNYLTEAQMNDIVVEINQIKESKLSVKVEN